MTMRLLTTLLVSIIFALFANAHGDEPHGAPPTSIGGVKNYFTVNAVSNQFEAVLRYTPLDAGDEAHLTLFLSDFVTNRPVDSARFEITSPEDGSLKLEVEQIDRGTYSLHVTFPQKKNYSLTTVIKAGSRSDLMLLGPIEVGKELPVAASSETHADSGFDSWWWVALLAFVVGLVLMYALMKARMNRMQRTASIIALVVTTSLPISTQNTIAHEGHDTPKKNTGDLSDEFEVGKETQFLYELYTTIPASNTFSGDIVLNGIIRPATNASATIVAPQTGTITSLNVRIGQPVTKGQTLAVVQQTLSTSEQVGLQTEKATAQAEYDAAQKEYNRLKSLEDIVAKKELQAAEIRLNAARERLNVYNRVGGNGQSFSIQSPVTGIIDNFNLTIGQQVQQGDALMNVFDNRNLKVEAVVYPNDLPRITNNARFNVSLSTNPSAKATATFSALSNAIDPQNQSTTLVLQLENPSGDFLPNQLVNVAVQTNADTTTRQATVPLEAITDVNGRPAVFVKHEPEMFEIVYLRATKPNAPLVPIEREVHGDDRIVVNGVYMLKSIFLNR